MEDWASPATMQLLRALRGERSQVAFSRRLGFASNVAADWEHGRRSPRLSRLIDAGPRLRIDIRGALDRFDTASSSALDAGVSAWLLAISEGTTQVTLAKRAGLSRHQVGRWVSGKAEPRLPDLLRFVDAATGRVPDLVAALVPIERVPALAARHEAVTRARRTVFEHPWASAVLPLLETSAYLERPRHDDAWIARALDISTEAVTRTISALVGVGAARWKGPHLAVSTGLTIDARASRDDKLRLRRFWAEQGAARVGTGLSAYNVFAVSNADLARVRELQGQFFREMRSLVAASDPAASDTVGLVVVQVLDLVDRTV